MITNPVHEATPAPERVRPASFDVYKVRKDFPIFSQRVHGHPLVFLDSAASAQKPQQVLDAIRDFDATSYANVHRGVHTLSQRATRAYEAARLKVQRFIGAASDHEIVFTSGTTGAINLVAATYGQRFIGEGDEIVVTTMEHHSNIVPWQLLCAQKGALLKVIPINEAGELQMDVAKALIGPRTKLVTLGHVSNALGTINPVREIIALAHAHGVPVLLDGAQAVPHLKVDVQELDCDFYAFSGHKLFGPTGIGVLYGKRTWLDTIPPWQGGGDMIESVSFEGSVWAEPPAKFEAGTPNITGAVGLGAVIDYLQTIDQEAAWAHEDALLAYGTEALSRIPAVRLVGTAAHKTGVLSFVVEGVHAQDVGTVLDQQGIAVRVGHHCAQPVMAHLGIAATVRASLAFYNTREDIDSLVEGLQMVVDIFG